MTGTTRFAELIGGALSQDSRGRDVGLARSIGMAALVVLGAASLAVDVRAQDAPQLVIVGNATYRVTDDTVVALAGNGQLDPATRDKALFTARVLQDQVLNSNFTKRIFAANYRAVVFADESSGRLIEPWRKLRGTSSAALAQAKSEFKAWATSLAADPGALMLATARWDYLDGIEAYRENAAIYRSVVIQHDKLSYERAIAWMGNAWPTIRLAYARGLEEQLGARRAAAGSPRALPQGGVERFSQRLETEILNRVETDVRTAEDLDRMSVNVRNILESDSTAVREYRGAISPPAVRFAPNEPNVGGARPQTASTGAAGGETSIATAQPSAKTAPLVDTTGDSLPSPFLLRRGSAPGNVVRPNPPSQGAAGNPARNSTATAPGGDGPGPAGVPPARLPGPAGTEAGGAAGAAGDQSDLIIPDNLKTYSSKGYHRGDGWVFDPSSGLWRDPNDPTQAASPTVITCCDDTGLAFPSDAVEVQQDYVWNLAGTDPNCGRLYDCGPTSGNTVPPNPTVPAGPTDRDAEILQAFTYIYSNVPEDRRRRAAAYFMLALPGAYYDRAVHIFNQFRSQRSASPTASGIAPAPVIRSGESPRPVSSGSSPRNQSDITGLGGGVSSHYQPVTQSSAQAIMGKYKSVPGGVTLEGASPDLGFVKKVSYQTRANAFIINDDVVYLNPVSPSERAEIERALAGDDKLGVSLGGGALLLVYGKLPPQSSVAVNLELADHFLGDIAFGRNQLTRGYRFPGGFVPKGGGSNVAVYFNLSDFRFVQGPDGELHRSTFALDSTLVPLAEAKTKEGGHLPDFDRIKSGDVARANVDNLTHLQENVEYYARERIIRQAAAYGEIAAFVRSLKAANLKIAPGAP
jgi:hypothetical protein